MVTALLLARRGLASTLFDARPVDDLLRDRRLLALSRGSLQILDAILGAGALPLAPIRRVHVSSRNQAGSALLGSTLGSTLGRAAGDSGSAGDSGTAGDPHSGGEPVGATVWYADLVAALARAVERDSSIAVERLRRVLDLHQHPESVRVALDGGAETICALAIDAEGGPNRLRNPGDAAAARSHALLADLTFDALTPGDAFERFTAEGPLALLPVPGNRQQMSMIWCLPSALAHVRHRAPESALLQEIARILGPRLATPTAIGPRSLFPLQPTRVDRVCEHRLVHIGNSAQVLHPVAGQGFNLGLRDCVCLVDCLTDTAAGTDVRRTGGDPAALTRALAQALAHYGAMRRLDRAVVPALTGMLPGLFAATPLPVASARSIALGALDLLPGVRRAFARLLMFGVRV